MDRIENFAYTNYSYAPTLQHITVSKGYYVGKVYTVDIPRLAPISESRRESLMVDAYTVT